MVSNSYIPCFFVRYVSCAPSAVFCVAFFWPKNLYTVIYMCYLLYHNLIYVHNAKMHANLVLLILISTNSFKGNIYT
jgi:hypothetical protein